MMIVLVAIGLISTVLMIGAIVALLSRQPDSDLAETSRPDLIGFLIATGALGLASGLAALPFPSPVMQVTYNFRFSAVIWSVLATFSLIVSSAGLMRQALQVMARTGVVILLLLQFPLWQGFFFRDPALQDRGFLLSGTYNLAGLINIVLVLFYAASAAFLLWLHRPRLISRMGQVSLFMTLAAQALALVYPESGTIGIAMVLGTFVGVVLVFEAQWNRKFVSN